MNETEIIIKGNKLGTYSMKQIHEIKQSSVNEPKSWEKGKTMEYNPYMTTGHCINKTT